jgi:hypothetical protein
MKRGPSAALVREAMGGSGWVVRVARTSHGTGHDELAHHAIAAAPLAPAEIHPIFYG